MSKVAGYPRPSSLRERRRMFPCTYWVCACGYGEHGSESTGGRPADCPYCDRTMRILEEHWHKKPPRVLP